MVKDYLTLKLVTLKTHAKRALICFYVLVSVRVNAIYFKLFSCAPDSWCSLLPLVTSTHNQNKRSKSGLSIVRAAVFLYCIRWKVSIHQVQYLLLPASFRWLEVESLYHHVQSVGISLVSTHFMGSWKVCVVFYNFCSWSSSFMKSKFFVIVYRLCRNLYGAIHHHHHHRLFNPGWGLASSSKCRQRLYPGHSPPSFCNTVSLRLPLPRQSILISVGHVLVDLHGLSTISF